MERTKRYRIKGFEAFDYEYAQGVAMIVENNDKELFSLSFINDPEEWMEKEELYKRMSECVESLKRMLNEKDV